MKNPIFFFFLTIFTLCAMSAQAQRVFRHPGGILSADDLERIRTHVNAGDEPWASCWNSMQEDPASKCAYTASPSSELGGSNGNRQRAAADAYAAMINAIEWHVTGKEEHAQCAARILSAWGNAIETSKDELYMYPCRAMIAAAEMLRNSDGSFYSGWADKDRDTFLDKVRNVMVPACRTFCTHYATHPSWFTPAALSVLGAGVLLDDETLYDEGYQLMLDTSHWGTMYGGSIDPDGQMREMGRDNVHGGLTLGDITQACLFAWNQGDDLFAEGDHRLLRGMEYWCRYNTGHPDTPYQPTDCSGLDYTTGYWYYYISTHNNGYRLRTDACSFEAVYHHYKDVLGWDEETHFPYLGIAAKLARPDSNNQMLGYGTLLFTVDAANSPYFTERPDKPAEVKAEDAFKAVNISWQHPVKEDARGFRIYRSTNGKVFSLLETKDYYANHSYKDTEVECGKTYYYKVQLVNKAGYSEMSDIVSATPQAGGEVLPKGWYFYGVGSSAYGSGRYDEAQNGSFAVEGLGKDIGGTSDAHGFVYQKMKGDATLTARIVSTKETFWKVGLLMRGSLSGSSQRVALTLGETGCRMVRMCARSQAGGNTTWKNCTNAGFAPMWMRLERKGNTFTAYISRNGDNWHNVGEATVAMPETFYVGMASCTGSEKGTVYQAAFDHVTLNGDTQTPTKTPSVPNGLDAEWTASNQAYVSWYAVQEADSYILYRSVDGVDYEQLAEVGGRQYTDTLPGSGKYYYKVAAKNDFGLSKTSPVKAVDVYVLEKLSGTVIGTSGSWNNNSATTKYAAFDNNLSTYFDAKEASGAWVGIDLGDGNERMLTHVMFAPRHNFPDRMTGGVFQVANQASFSDAVTVATIEAAPDDGALTSLPAPASAAYRYIRYLAPDNSNCNVAEVQFYGVSKENDTPVNAVLDKCKACSICFNTLGVTTTCSQRQVVITPDGRKTLVTNRQ